VKLGDEERRTPPAWRRYVCPKCGHVVEALARAAWCGQHDRLVRMRLDRKAANAS
jgi:hypothetical protein